MGSLRRTGGVLALLSGSFFALLALLGWPCRELIKSKLHEGIRAATLLSPGAPRATWNRMVRNDLPGDAPDIINIFVWNITNLAAVRRGAKPELREVGPYVFRKWRVKEDVRFDRFGHVSFSEYHYFTPVHGAAGAGGQQRDADADEVVTLNLPLLGVLATLQASSRLVRAAAIPAIEIFMRDYPNGTFSGLFMRRRVSELVFGYEDELLTLAARWVPSLRGKTFFKLVENMTSPQEALDKPRNVMDTSPRSPAWAPRWEYVTWEGHADVTCWASGHREAVAGASDALQFPPSLTAEDVVHVFVPELFRQAQLNATGEVHVHGIRLLKYEPADSLARPNATYFTEIAGLMNITACAAVGAEGDATQALGPPVLMSMPHFCYVDRDVATQTIGTHCNLSRHTLWLGVEPVTGITMAAAKRLQVSSRFDSRYLAFDPHLRDTILPIFWAEEITSIDANRAASFRASVYTVTAIVGLLGRPSFYGAAALAAVCAFAICYALLCFRHNNACAVAPTCTGLSALAAAGTVQPVEGDTVPEFPLSGDALTHSQAVPDGWRPMLSDTDGGSTTQDHDGQASVDAPLLASGADAEGGRQRGVLGMLFRQSRP